MKTACLNPLYSGHSNIELYGNSFNPKKATAGGFFATDNPDIASSYASSKIGIKEYWENGEQYRIYNPKTKKFNKLIREITLTDEQIRIFNEWWGENYGGTLSQHIKENSRSDAKLKRYQYFGGANNLEAFWYVMETMGDTIAYAKPGEDPLYVRQQKNTFEELLDKAGIKWQSYEWMQPGVMKVFLKIENPLDTSKPFPTDVMASLEKTAKREKRMTDDEWRDAHWTKNYPVYKWIEDIKAMETTGEETFWATQIPTKARNVLKEFGYDGIKDVGGKMGGAGHEVWIALDSTQIKSATGNNGGFDPNNADIRFQLKVDPFYSKLERTEAKMPEKTSAAQVLAIIDNPRNVKPEEVKWSGIRQWLQGKGKEKVTKAEVVEFLQGNKLKISEMTMGSSSKAQDAIADDAYFNLIDEKNNVINILTSKGVGSTDAYNIADHIIHEEQLSNRLNKVISMAFDTEINVLPHELSSLNDIAREYDRIGKEQDQDIKPTKFSEYTLPGGDKQGGTYLAAGLQC